MTVSVEIVNASSRQYAHPELPGTLAAGASRTLELKTVNADDYAANYDNNAKMGIAIFSDGVAAAAAAKVTGDLTVTTQRALVVEATAPLTITLPDAATKGDGYTISVLVKTSAGIAATGILTMTGNAADTETVTIDAKTYTFQATLTDVDGNVLVGATASDSLDNLIAAITLGAGSGTTYAASTTEHPTVTAAAGTGDTMDVTAKTAGTAGNSIATTETLANGSWGGATLSGGDAAGDITVAAAGSDTVLGGATHVLADAADSVQLKVVGTNWADNS